MTAFPKARALVLSRVAPLGTEGVELRRLGGRVFSQDLTAPFDVPRFDNSQVDGYAFRSEDDGPRRIVGESAAGGPSPQAVGPGEAMRIFTGAPLPEGADTIAMQEDCALDPPSPLGERGRDEGASVVIDAPIATGDFIRRKGEEMRRGEIFEVAGRLATPPLVGLAASFGLAEVEVFRRPRVTIVATGNELVAVGSALGPGQVYASNPPALAEAIRALGIPEVETRLVGDAAQATEEASREALAHSDVLITVGGVSVGDHDLVRPALASLGVEEVLWRVAMKPGKPFYFGKRGENLVFGLPGNPVSALVTFAVLVRPALRRMLGLVDAEEEATARLATPIARKDLRYEFLRATLRNGVATPVEAQGSHMQTGLAFADALIHVPDGVASIRAGEEATVTPLKWTLL